MPLTAELASLPFCCGETEGDKDLEDFFHHNALLYAQERLGKTYCFVNNEGEFSEIVAFFTVSNDSVKTTFIPKPSVLSKVGSIILNGLSITFLIISGKPLILLQLFIL